MYRLILLLLSMATASTAHGEDVGLIQLWNYYEYSGRLLSSGQPTRDQFPEIAAAGVEAVINLAPVTAPGALADEGEVVSGLDMGYAHIPVDWDNPPLADLETFFTEMERFTGKRVLVHCYANARASTFVYLWRTLQAGHNDARARAAMIEVWDLNEGYEFRNVEQWQRFVANARNAPPRTAN